MSTPAQQARHVLRLFADIEGLTPDDTRQLGQRYHWSEEQVETLQVALGAAQEGFLTIREVEELRAVGFQDAFINILRGGDGQEALQVRVSRLVNSIESPRSPLNLKRQAMSSLIQIIVDPGSNGLRDNINIHRSILPALTRIFENEDLVSEIRERAFDLLVKIGDDSSAYLFARVLRQDSNPVTRTLAIQGLYQIGTPETLPFLQLGLRDVDGNVRASSLVAIAQLQTRAYSVLSEVIQLAKEDPSSTVRLEAIDAVVAIQRRTPEVRNLIRHLVADPNPRIRRKAVFAWGQLGPLSPSELGRLIELFQDSDSIVRAAAFQSMGDQGQRTEKFLDQLIYALSDSDSTVRRTAIRQIARYGSEGRRALPRLEELASSDSVSNIRDQARRAIRVITQ